MHKYWNFWKRGWWALLFVFAVNLPLGLIVIGLESAFGAESNTYNALALGTWLVIGAPFCGWAFEYFARKSSRLSDIEGRAP